MLCPHSSLRKSGNDDKDLLQGKVYLLVGLLEEDPPNCKSFFVDNLTCVFLCLFEPTMLQLGFVIKFAPVLK